MAKPKLPEKIVFWCGLFPATLLVDLYVLLVLYIGWCWLCQ